MACTIGNELLEIGYAVKFMTTNDLLTQIKSTYNRESEQSEVDLLNKIKHVEILILDDFGAEKTTEWVDQKLFEIVNDRYVEGKITIYTSNYTPNELTCDRRIRDRIIGTSYMVVFPEVSVRKIKGGIMNG